MKKKNAGKIFRENCYVKKCELVNQKCRERFAIQVRSWKQIICYDKVKLMAASPGSRSEQLTSGAVYEKPSFAVLNQNLELAF